MPVKKESLHKVEAFFADHAFKQLESHCDRMGIKKAHYVVMIVGEYLQKLDEQEAYIQSQKKPKTTRVGNLPVTGARGMEVEIKTPSTAQAPEPPIVAADLPTGLTVEEAKKIPEKLRKTFSRLCAFVEESKSEIDRSLRVQTCLDDLKEHAKTPEDAHVAFLALQNVLKARDALRPKPPVTAPEDVPVDGDVDD